MINYILIKFRCNYSSMSNFNGGSAKLQSMLGIDESIYNMYNNGCNYIYMPHSASPCWWSVIIIHNAYPSSSATSSGIILCMCPANERRRYNVTSPLIGWAHTKWSLHHHHHHVLGRFNIMTIFPAKVIPIIKIWQSWECLTLVTDILIWVSNIFIWDWSLECSHGNVECRITLGCLNQYTAPNTNENQ